jgi:hypothetical protein
MCMFRHAYMIVDAIGPINMSTGIIKTTLLIEEARTILNALKMINDSKPVLLADRRKLNENGIYHGKVQYSI